MPTTARNCLVVKFEKNSYIEFRKLAFKHGISCNEFFAFVAELATLNDDRVMEMFKELKILKAERLIKGEEKINYNAENLYDAIERNLKK